MGVWKPVGPVSATSGTPTPIFTGPSANLLSAASFSITNNIATIVVANTYIPGNQVGLYGFGTGTYFNGLAVTVLDATPTKFRFAFTHSNVGSTADTSGRIFIQPPTYRGVRIEIQADASTHIIYVGDGTVSSTNYVTALLLSVAARPNAPEIWQIEGDAIEVGRIHVTTDSSGTKAQVSVLY